MLCESFFVHECWIFSKVDEKYLLSRSGISDRLFNYSLPQVHITPGSTKENPLKGHRFFSRNKSSNKSQLNLLGWISHCFLRTQKSNNKVTPKEENIQFAKYQGLPGLIAKEFLMIVHQFDLMPVLDVELQRCSVLCGKTHQPRKQTECLKLLILYGHSSCSFLKSNRKLSNPRNSSGLINQETPPFAKQVYIPQAHCMNVATYRH